MAQNSRPPSYDASAATHQALSLEVGLVGQVPELIAPVAAANGRGGDRQSQMGPILTQLQNITTALQTLAAEQQAQSLKLASIEARLVSTESRTLNARIRERNAASTRADVHGRLEPLHDVRLGGPIPNCPATESAISRLTRVEATRILLALDVDFCHDTAMSDMREVVRQEFILIYKTHR